MFLIFRKQPDPRAENVAEFQLFQVVVPQAAAAVQV